MVKFQRLFKNLSATDVVVLVFYALLTGILIFSHSVISQWPLLVFFNLLLIGFVFWISDKAQKSGQVFWKSVHFYYVAPLIFLTFKEVYVLIGAIHNFDYDNLLISIDRYIFGTDPTVFLYQFSHPILTEILQIAYGTFFFLPLILGVEFHLKKEYTKFQFIVFAVVLGFFLSYLGYFLLPAVGPRFTLHDFHKTNIELPGLFLTNILREIVNAGESIPSGTQNPVDFVQRDVFPSGHTQMTLIIMYLAVKLRSSNKIFFLVDGSLLIIATVYLRYHYVIDLAGGLVFMIITMISGKWIFNWWQKKNNNPTFEY